jgi:nicotinate-nucleotide pyrophosphorylase (carboxylating)
MFEWNQHSVQQTAAADVARALQEDVGAADLTAGLVPSDLLASARIIAREPAVICGVAWVEAAFLALDPQAKLSWHVGEGQTCQADQLVLEVRGQARALLTAERTALNFLQLLSAVASKTRTFVDEVAKVPGARAQIVDTRKTLPGLRMAQKYAVIAGGGGNHRIGLFDAVLIKENHIAAAGGIAQVLAQTAEVAPRATFVEIEVENLDELDQALAAGARMILLDNFSQADMVQAVARNAGQAVLEVSGGVSLATVGAIAATGVDRISVGGLTKDVKAVDFSMRFQAQVA